MAAECKLPSGEPTDRGSPGRVVLGVVEVADDEARQVRHHRHRLGKRRLEQAVPALSRRLTSSTAAQQVQT